MKSIQAALWMEILKARKTRIFPLSIYFFIFIGIMMGMLMFLSMHPEIASRSATLQMKTSFLGGSGWSAYFGLLLQIVLTVGVIGSGFVTSWGFGREFSDRVIKDLLALPISRSAIVISKMIVMVAWSILLSATILAAAMITGLAIRLPGWEEASLAPFLGTYLVCTLLNALLVTPVALVASAGRGYMLPISFVILIMILTQLLFVGIPWLTERFPWALPALVSGVAGVAAPKASFWSYLVYGMVVIASWLGTIGWWRYADQR